MINPAVKIIEVFGGVALVAEATNRGRAQIHRWTYPRERGGTGGLVPSEAQIRLLCFAAEHGIPLEPRHFFEGLVPDKMLEDCHNG